MEYRKGIKGKIIKCTNNWPTKKFNRSEKKQTRQKVENSEHRDDKEGWK